MKAFTMVLSRRPAQLASGQYVQVEVENALPGRGAVVDDQAERILYPQLARHLGGSQHHVTQQGLIPGVGAG
jgi:hypothetical protein